LTCELELGQLARRERSERRDLELLGLDGVHRTVAAKPEREPRAIAGAHARREPDG
jgi:hypothetical protein